MTSHGRLYSLFEGLTVAQVLENIATDARIHTFL
jgi:hypothetical protein